MSHSSVWRSPSDAWQWAIGTIQSYGDLVRTEDGQLTKEVMNLMVTVTDPLNGWPVGGSGWDLAALKRYAEELLNDDDNTGFDYTYGERLLTYPDTDGNYVIDQIGNCIAKLKANPTTRRAIAITWVPDWDYAAGHVPCLQSVSFLVRQDKLHLTAFFRSWDCGRAMVPNMYGLSKLLRYVADEVGMETGSLTCIAASGHIYEI